MKISFFILSLALSIPGLQFRQLHKRALQKSHERTQLEKWEDKFFHGGDQFDQTLSLVTLINKLALDELSGCTAVILYDRFTENSNDRLLEKLFRTFPIPYVHGQITKQYRIKVPQLLTNPDTCISYILFLKDVMRCKTIIGSQNTNKVVLIARSSQWRVYEFLANEESQNFMNLLVIAMSEKIVSSITELPYILYTHKLYVDALGSSIHQVLTSWKNSTLTRPHVPLFPKKIPDGFAGHRFIVSVSHQPPFVIKKVNDDNNDIQWDGIEIRLVNLLSKMFNFTTDYREAKNWNVLGSAEAVTAAVKSDKASLGIAGLYITDERMKIAEVSNLHSQDCAAFISLTSTALPRYRAIMGPFHWSVWLALTLIYLFAIFPLAFSDKHSLRHLIERPEEVENMFWYVFGTFTNAFTFLGRNSWSQSNKFATRLLIGFYWLFTIIITACYTGSIIAFVTLPVYPTTVDTPKQLVSGRYQVGTLDKGGWQYWFENSSDPVTLRLLKKVDLVPDIESGLKNTTKAFFWPYSFLGSRAQLDYIVRTNFTIMNKRSLLHISSKCFVPFGVGIIYNKNSIYSKIIDLGLLRTVQNGLVSKIRSDIEWSTMRSATGKLLGVNSFSKSLKSLTLEDRALTLDDTQGMFLLLGIGFLIGGASLLSEWMGGCLHLCKRKRPSTVFSIQSNYRSHEAPTPREKLDSLQYNSLENHRVEDDLIEEDQEYEHKCIVHKQDVRESEDNIEEHIDKLFDFEELFGDPNANEESTSQQKEELDEVNE